MQEKFISEKNVKFLLYEVFDAAALCRYDYYSQHSRKMFDMVLAEALKLAKNLYYPIFEDMDRKPPEYVNGSVKVHPQVRRIMKESGDGGWIGATFPADQGGEQLPWLVAGACAYIFIAANYSASVYPELTRGAAHLIATFADDTLKKTYLPDMLAGNFQGTMALTEPEAGSSLADITTMAEPHQDGYYTISGQKVFISGGDHDGVDNVIHLMLAKIKGAPTGVKGISLFVVPKLRNDEHGNPTSNDVAVSQIYHKMGYRGCPITQLVMGEKNDCRGYLVGEPHKGLFYMFQMMNESRLGVGLGATGIASAAYYAALQYTRTRKQGRKPGQKDPASPMIPIIEHADVKRMLLFQRSVTEGALSLIMQCYTYADLERVTRGSDKEKYHLLLELLTPIAKTFPSEYGILSTSQSIQCFGGYGYCEDFPVEQLYRDARIHPIHEGTTAIQGMDILGRKVMMNNGKAYSLFIDEVNGAIARTQADEDLFAYGKNLADALKTLDKVTLHLMGVANRDGAEIFLADAVLYLDLFSLIAVSWQWLIQALAAKNRLTENTSQKDRDFYEGKIMTFRYVVSYELPKIHALAERLMADDPISVDCPVSYFND
ncbi:MAG: acyl-CoA dehydrogenase [Desulfobacteraceae bacterium]|nr:acyl-CoA dehydrogenase [Desulfobacteraceae bacterium]